MTSPAPLTRLTLLLPRLSDLDAFHYGEGDADAAWAMRLIDRGGVGPAAVAEIGPTQTLLLPDIDAAIGQRFGTEVAPEGLVVPRRLSDAEVGAPEVAGREVMESIEIAMATDSRREIEAVITVLPFRAYWVREPD